MKRIAFLTIASCLLLLKLSFSQSKSFKKLYVEAESFFLYGDYINALPKYSELINLEPINANVNYSIGVCYLNIPGNYDNAITYLERAVTDVTNSYREGSYKEKQAPEEAIFYLAQAYRLKNKLDDAINSYQKYKALLDVSEVYFIDYVELQIQNCHNAEELMKNPIEVIKENLGDNINTESEERDPAINKYENIMLFTRGIIITDREINEDVLVNYIFQTVKTEAGWSKPKNLSKRIYADEFGIASFISDDGTYMLITIDDYGVFNIYESWKVGSKWSEIKKLPKSINSRSNEKSAMLTSNGKEMYFVSDRAGGLGGKDIYKSTLNSKGDWGEPVNLGPSINTQFEEETPFYLEDEKTLYFSSESHHSIGGYDVFSSRLQDDGSWSEPLNIGYPANSLDDDLSYRPINNEYAYMARYTDETFQNKDIFRIKIQALPAKDLITEKKEDEVEEFAEAPDIKEDTDSLLADVVEKIQEEIFEEDTTDSHINISTSRTGTVVYGIPEITINGVINLQDNKEEFSNFNVSIINSESNKTVGNVVPDNFGAFSYVVNPGNYKLIFSGNGYKKKSTIVNIPVEYTRKTAEVNIEMVPIEVSAGEYFVIKSVFFDYNDFSLSRNSKIELEKLSTLMQHNPSLYIEVIGHADSRGGTEYNLALSKKRSRSVLEYISENGIENERFVAKGVGEKGEIAINQNPDGTDNPEGRKYNRRVDIKILRSNNDNVTTQDIYVPEHLRLKGSLKYTILLVETSEKLGPEYFNKYDDAITNIWISQTSNGYVYSAGEYTNKSDAIQLLNKAVDIGFPKAGIINNLELKKLHDSGTPTAKAAKQREKEILETGTFTIQLMALKNPVAVSYFNNLSNVKKNIGKDGYTRYTYGEYKGYHAAKASIQEIVAKGYIDAFVVNVARLN